MIITKQYILDNRTKKGAWTQPQIEALGIKWPPRKGWIERAIGKEISLEDQRIFESKVGIRLMRKTKKKWRNADFNFENRKQQALDRFEEKKSSQRLDMQHLANLTHKGQR